MAAIALRHTLGNSFPATHFQQLIASNCIDCPSIGILIETDLYSPNPWFPSYIP